MILKAIALTVSALIAGTMGQDEHKDETEKAKTITHTNVIAIEQKGDKPSIVHINGKEYTLELKDMKEGEEKVVATDSGNLTITKQADRYQIIDSEGTVMSVPLLNNRFDDISFTTVSDDDEEGTFSFTIDSAGNTSVDKDTVNIEGLDDLDEATKEKVRQALKEAGVEKDVQFGSNVTWIDKDGNTTTHAGRSFMFIKKDGSDGKDHKIIIKKARVSGDKDENEEDDEN